MKTGMFATALLLVLACGGSKDGQPLAIDPDPPTAVVGETLAITASPQASNQAEPAGEVTWEVQETYGGGLLQSQGLRVTYVAPEAAGTYHLLLWTQSKGGRARKQVVEVRVLANPMVDPASASLPPGGSQQFRVHMKGLATNAATWAVEEADGGQITQDGHYLAPRKPGVYHLTATSALDPSAIARASVTVSEF